MTREEAINEIKTWSIPSKKGREVLETLIPELRESEDERIRGRLIQVVSAIAGGWPFETYGITKKEAIAYLEKQKEEEGYEAIPVESTLEYKLGFKAGKESEKQKEQNKCPEFCSGHCVGCERNEQKDYRKLYEDIAKSEWFKKAYEGKSLGGDDEQKEQNHDGKKWIFEDEYQKDLDRLYNEGKDDVLNNPSKYGLQKEQKPVEKLSKEDYVKKFKALCDAYEIKLPNREYDIYHLCKDLHKLFGDIQKPAEWEDLTWKDIVELEGIINNVHYEFRNGIGQESFGKEVLEKFREYKGDEYLDEKEQKPTAKVNGEPIPTENQSVDIPLAEWSEEDEEIFNNIIEKAKGGHWIEVNEITWLINRFKSFRPLPKQEWSEEDEKMLTGIIERGSVQVPPYTTALREEQIEWLMNRWRMQAMY